MTKRSAQIALLLTGATAVGATNYAFTPRGGDCQPTNPASQTAAPVAGSQTAAANPTPCREPRRWYSSSSYHGGSSHWFWGGSSSSANTTRSGTSVAFSGGSSPAAVASGGSSVARGGFGATGHAVSAAS